MRLDRTILNFKSLSIPTQWQMTKAKRLYVKSHKKCAICGYKKRLEVHHVVPVHVDVSLACDQENFITLCRTCHFTFGHFHNFRKYWNPHIKKLASHVSNLYNVDWVYIKNKLSL